MPLMEAPLQSDMRVMEGFLKKIQEFLELMGTKDTVYRLSEELLKYYRATGILNYRIIPQMYAQEIRETLIQNEIPFMATGDSAGNTVIILPEDSGQNKYSPLFERVFMHHPEYYKQHDNETWCKLANEGQVNGVVSFTFDNEIDADIFKNKVFAEGKGIITTDTVEKDKDRTTVTVTVREDDLIDESDYKDAVDAYIDTAISLTVEQSFARRFAVRNDQIQTKNCMDMLFGKEGKSKAPFVIHDGADKMSDYFMFKDGHCSYFTYSKKEQQWYSKDVKIEGGNNDAVLKMIERHMSYIPNVKVSTVGEFNKFMSRSQDYIRSEYVDKQKRLYAEVILTAGIESIHGQETALIDNAMKDMHIKYPELEGIRPDFSVDFLKKFRTDLSNDKQFIMNDPDAVRRQDNLIKNLDKIIEGEEANKAKYSDLQVKCHDILREEKQKNPDVDPEMLLNRVRQFLDKNGMRTDKIKVTHLAFDRYEMEAREIRERIKQGDDAGHCDIGRGEVGLTNESGEERS